MFGIFLRASVGIIQPSTLTTLLSGSIVEKIICSQILSKLAMKRRFRATGKRIRINTLVVTKTMAARSVPREAMEAEEVVEEETPIGARLMGCR